MYKSYVNKKKYTAYIEGLKRKRWKEITRARVRYDCRTARDLIKKREFGLLLDHCMNRLRKMLEEGKRNRPDRTGGRSRKTAGAGESVPERVPAQRKGGVPNYFSDEKIAVYTVIFGNYDSLHEPECCPDNCDFYLISDRILPPEGSVWKPLVLPAEVQERISGMNAKMKNRFLKLLPHLLFPEYNWSVYLDGNIQLVTDPTEYIHRMPVYGVSLHRHFSRDCVYEESKTILNLKKASETEMAEVLEFLVQEQMPAHYGLLECPVIVRQHNLPQCVELMEAWWELFERFPYRDQMLLPCVLFRRGIRMEEIDWLGEDVRRSLCFRRYDHLAPSKQILENSTAIKELL
ncbi:MAG: DUF616 domain-containing protein [Eubacteriales bacterium]|nr:DUF616 domain-containing protein [Eubacteriales bacterium]